MKLADARTLAETIQWAIAPGCKDVRIAGSIRRLKGEPGDIELVAVPDQRPPKPVFGQPNQFANTLEAILYDLRLGSPDGLCLRLEKGGSLYKQFWVSVDNGATYLIKLDLFLVTTESFPVQFVIRTGPAEFSHWIVTPRAKGGCMPDGYKCESGRVICVATGEPMPFEEEIDFLGFLGLGWIEPYARKANWGYWRNRPNMVSPKPVDAPVTAL
jgi:DNA polymerase/3'-5' exonuclease PolX